MVSSCARGSRFGSRMLRLHEAQILYSSAFKPRSETSACACTGWAIAACSNGCDDRAVQL